MAGGGRGGVVINMVVWLVEEALYSIRKIRGSATLKAIALQEWLMRNIADTADTLKRLRLRIVKRMHGEQGTKIYPGQHS